MVCILAPLVDYCLDVLSPPRVLGIKLNQRDLASPPLHVLLVLDFVIMGSSLILSSADLLTVLATDMRILSGVAWLDVAVWFGAVTDKNCVVLPLFYMRRGLSPVVDWVLVLSWTICQFGLEGAERGIVNPLEIGLWTFTPATWDSDPSAVGVGLPAGQSGSAGNF